MSFARWLRHYSIRSRMIGAIVVVLALVVLVGSVGMLGLQRSGRLVDHFVASIHRDTVELSALRGELGEIRRHEAELMLDAADADAVKGSKARWAKAVELARARAGTLSRSAVDEGAKVAGRVGERLGAYQSKADAVWARLGEGKFAGAAELNGAFAEAKQALRDTESEINAFGEHLKAEARSEDENRQTIQRQSLAWFAGALALAMLVIVPSALANMVSICAPVERAREHAMRIASGNLTVEITDDGNDENARLFAELATMQQALRRLVGDLRAASENIGSASAEIASGNTDLSHRTEQTASSLQQAAGSLQQITGSVRQTADSAAQANQLAASASSVATRGGEAVAHVVSTMGQIEASSRKIADIIGTIDGIAFQTNILALNAAVEAARAGEQGRGFAVVAGEVRTLAQRSAEAAREIKSLIGASVERVEAGTRLVRDAGTTMSEIVDSVRRVTDVIGEITASTTEQSQAIGQVNAAVTQLDQMTQQNAALVEQSAAAAESLKDQAGRLVSVVGAFQVAQAAATAGATIATPGRAASTSPPRDAPKTASPARTTKPARHAVAASDPARAAPSPAEPAVQAQQVIARARAGTPPADRSDGGESDWESF